MPPTDTRRTRRKWLFRISASAILIIVVVALPWLASTPPAVRWLVMAANRQVAPARIELGSVRLSWLGSTQISGLAIHSQAGKKVISVSHARFDHGLLSLLRPMRGNLELDGAALDVERRADGSSDLEEVLTSLRQKKAEPEVIKTPFRLGFLGNLGLPKRDVTVKIVNGSLRFQAPELPDPVTSRRVEGIVRLGGPNASTTYRLSFADPADGDNATLEVSGELAHHAPAGELPKLTTTFKADRWPWSYGGPGATARGRFQGTLLANRQGTLWTWSGDGQWLDVNATGPSLSGDRLQLKTVKANYELAETEIGWDFRRLDLESPLGSLKAVNVDSGADDGAGSTRIEGRIDLAAIAHQLPQTLHIQEGLTVERGEASFTVDIEEKSPKDEQRLKIHAKLSDLVAQGNGRVVELHHPGTFTANLFRRPTGLGIEALSLKTQFLQATGTGDFDRGIVVSATLDLERLQQELKTLVDFNGVTIAGKGQLGLDYRRVTGETFAGRLSTEIHAMKVVGLSTEPLTHDVLRLDVTTKGTVAEWGQPDSWSHAQLAVKSDTFSAEASLTAKPSNASIKINSLRANLQLPAPANAKGPHRAVETVRILARGEYNPNEGILDLQPMAGGSRPEPIALAGKGLHLIGLRTDEARMELNLAMDFGRLDRALAGYRQKPSLGFAGKGTLTGGFVLAKDGKMDIGVSLDSPELSVSKSGEKAQRPLGPAVIGFHLQRAGTTEPINIDTLIVAVPCARLDAKGTVDNDQQLEIRGKITPAWETIDGFLAQAIEPGSRVRGEPRPLILRARLNEGDLADSLQTLEAELGLDRFEANVLGMQIAPVSIVAHGTSSGILIDPIETTLNGGTLKIKPELIVDDRGAISVRLGAGSQIVTAEINDEVSRGFLAYMAPVLGDATHVGGKFSASFDRAEIPLTGRDSQALVAGRMKFDDVVFDAGNLAGELLGMAGTRRNAKIQLNEPIEIRIANGRVYQRGLSVPVGRNARIVFEGSVGFDRSLALRARMPIARGALGGNGELDDLVESLRVGVPITGTLSRPRIDRQALRLGLKNVDSSALKRKAANLLEKLVQPEPESEATEPAPR